MDDATICNNDVALFASPPMTWEVKHRVNTLAPERAQRHDLFNPTLHRDLATPHGLWKSRLSMELIRIPLGGPVEQPFKA